MFVYFFFNYFAKHKTFSRLRGKLPPYSPSRTAKCPCVPPALLCVPNKCLLNVLTATIGSGILTAEMPQASQLSWEVFVTLNDEGVPLIMK